MGRRRFLHSLSSLGLSATTLSYITPDILNRLGLDLNEEVPYIARYRHINSEEIREHGDAPNREAVWDSVPRDKWILVKAAHDGRGRVEQTVRKHTDSDLIMPKVTTRVTGGHRSKSIPVDYVTNVDSDGASREPDITFEELQDILPETETGEAGGEKVEGIPVVPRKRTEHEGSSCKKFYYNSNYAHEIPGGCKADVGCGAFTLGTPAFNDSSGDRNMLSAGHAIAKDTVTRQPSCTQGHVDGARDQYYTGGCNDYGNYTPPHGHNGWDIYKYRLAEDDGTFKDDHLINGIVTWDQLTMYEGDTSKTLLKQGARTGTTSGYVKSAYKCNGHKRIDTSCDAYSRDSGGPIYEKVYDSTGDQYLIYIAAIFTHYLGDSCPGYEARGNAMEYIEDQLNVTV